MKDTVSSRTAPVKAFPSAQTAQVGGELADLTSDALFAGADDDLLPISPSSSDSHYEMSAVSDGEIGDSNDELPAFMSNTASLDDAHPSGMFEPASSEVFVASPWYDQSIESWNRYHFFVALGFGPSSLAVLGFFLVSALVRGHSIDSSITALIVGCLGMVAFLLLSVSAAALIVLLVDLGRTLRRLVDRSNRNASIASE